MFSKTKHPKLYDYDDLLTDDLSHVAKHLARFAGDEHEFRAAIYRAVHFDVFLVGNIIFPEHNTGDIVKILLNPDLTNKSKTLFNLMNGQDFSWPLYDKCVQIATNHNMPLSSFGLRLGEPPKKPTLDKADLDLLKVSDIKALLKKYAHSTSGNRDELVNRLWVFLPIQDTEKLLATRYQEALSKYQQKQIRHKYSLLASFVRQKYYFFDNIVRHGSQQLFRIKPELNFELCQEDDKKFAKLIDGVGYDNIIINNKINKSLPLHPTDMAYISYKFITKKS